MSVVCRTDFGDCVVLTLNREHALNAIDTAMVKSLENHLDELQADDCRGVVLTGAGRVFCVGTDLKESHADNIAEWLHRIHQLLFRIRQYPKPIVAALNGLVLGGGLELAAACLFRVASQGCQLGLPEIKLGVMPSYGGTVFITKLIGENRACELMLSGDSIAAEEAQRIGLLNRVVPEKKDLVAEALTFLRRFSCHSQVPFNATRDAVIGSAHLSVSDALAHEMQLVQQVGQSGDAQEGIAAFLEKRTPVWSDN